MHSGALRTHLIGEQLLELELGVSMEHRTRIDYTITTTTKLSIHSSLYNLVYPHLWGNYFYTASMELIKYVCFALSICSNEFFVH